MRPPLPQPVPELPVTGLRTATDAYAQRMGFAVDWTYEDALAGTSRDAARIFLRRRTPPEAQHGCRVTIRLNMASEAEVDQLYAEWKNHDVPMHDELHTAPYELREFAAEDVDGNRVRVFYDLGRQAKGPRGRRTKG